MQGARLALVIGVALASFAGGSASAAFVRQVPCSDCALHLASRGDVLWSQLDEPSGYAFADQRFEAVYAAYDCEGADDFVVSDVQGWDFTAVHTVGVQTTGGSPFFVNHFLYDDADGAPGAVHNECDFPANTNFVHDQGDIVAEIPGCLLPVGVHWLSQSVRQDFGSSGQHLWATRLGANGNEAVWRNPGDGFGSGCLDWMPANGACGMTGADFQFELLGVCVGCYRPPPVPTSGPFAAVLTVVAMGAGGAWMLRRRGGRPHRPW